MTKIRVLMAVAAAILLAGCTPLRVLTTAPQVPVSGAPVQAPSGAYTLDKGHAFLLFKVSHLGFSTYIGRFDAFDAALDFDAQDPTRSRLDVTIETGSVNSGNDKVDKQLRAGAMFDSENAPTAHFVSTRIERLSGNTGTIFGDLTIKNRTAPVALDVVFNGTDDDPFTRTPVLGFSAKASLKRSDWGLGQWLPAVGNTVTLEIEAEFRAAE